MKLQYALPAWAAALTGIDPQVVRYCVPYDLAPDGTLLKDGCLVVTRERLLVLGNERVLDEVPLEKGTKIVCSPQVDCGLLLARQEDGERFLCRFTMRHMVRISYVAKGATLLAEGCARQNTAAFLAVELPFPALHQPVDPLGQQIIRNHLNPHNGSVIN